MLGPQGDIVSVSYSPIVSPLAPKTCDSLSKPTNREFTTKVEWDTAVEGMKLSTVLPNYQPPPGLFTLKTKKPLKAEFAAGGGGGEDNKESPPPIQTPFDFVKRYWYILLPLLLSNFIGGRGEPPKAEGKAGERAPASSGTLPPAAASNSGGGDGARQRRGKRN